MFKENACNRKSHDDEQIQLQWQRPHTKGYILHKFTRVLVVHRLTNERRPKY